MGLGGNNEMERCLDRLKGKEYISESTIDFFRDLIRAQYKIKNRLSGEASPFSLTDDEVKERMHQGKPLISFDAIPLKPTHLKDLFQEICEIMQGNESSDRELIQRLVDAESRGELSLKTLIEKLLDHDSSYFAALSKKCKIDEDLLVFLALHLAKPFLEDLSERLQDNVADKAMDTIWLKNYCPICGSCAQIAKLEKGAGKKILYCLLCGSEWRFMRVKCPYCCNEEQETMRLLEEEGSAYRLDFCEQCKRYTKTFDERKGGDAKKVFIPSVEDLATMYLDIVAEKEGFERSWFFPPSVDELKADGKSKTLH